jgi:xanthine dehydrogenase accessory factor
VATSTDRATTGRLIVTADVLCGSFADSGLAAAVVLSARALLASGARSQLVRFRTGADRAEAQVFLDPVRDPDFEIVLFGAGHVGRALVEILARVPCTVTWVDGRETEFPAVVPANVAVVVTDSPEAEVAVAPEGAYFLVMTHSHALDQVLAESILKRGRFAYFGLIGSASKRTQFERRMTQRGIPPASMEDMTCPIGVPGIKGKEPATIAIAVAAQLIETKERHAAVGRAKSAAANG